MDRKLLVAAIIGLLFGLISGFFIANGINSAEINSLRGQIGQSKSTGANTASAKDGLTLGDDELKAKIAEADATPTNFTYQKNLGRALYRYASMKNDTALLDEAVRLLTRANSLDSKDYDVLVDLGNALFDTGYMKKDPAVFARARDLYNKALEAKPDDADVRTDLAISYVLDASPDFNRAVEDFQRALKANPKQERALSFLVQTYMQTGNWTAAAKTLELLKAVNPKNDRIDDLAEQIAAKQPKPIK
jgi:tetratricopeptide (TPR) repeat protein